MSFSKVIKELQGQRGNGSKPLKIDTELYKLEQQGNQELADEIIKALNDTSYSNLVIHDALRTEDIFVSHSAIRTWRIRNGILTG
tara:strand:- start:3331 stop:3585 length:255 start_codon:yes stop_codon:yes gene_type:complete